MKTLSIFGTTWRTGGTAAVSQLTVVENQRPRRIRAIADRLNAQEVLYVATCNRVEVVLLHPAGTDLDRARAARTISAVLSGAEARGEEPSRNELSNIRSWFGEEAVTHLFSVACGLDSAQPGEVEIRSQLKRALQSALDARLCSTGLEQLVSQSLIAARRVHRRTKIGVEKRSLAHLAVELALAGRLDPATDPPVALVGVSATTRKSLTRLARAGQSTLVVNRTVRRARELVSEIDRASLNGGASSFDAEVMSLDQFRDSPPAVSALITAVSSPDPILDRAQLERLINASPRAPTIIDLGVPANVSHFDAKSLGVDRLGMDEINRRAQEDSADRRLTLEQAESELLSELTRFRESTSHETLGTVMRGLGEQTRETLKQGVLEILRCDDLGTDDPRQTDIDRWVDQMAKRMSHVPFVGLRALAASHGPEAVESFLEAADPVLAAEYRSQLGEPR